MILTFACGMPVSSCRPTTSSNYRIPLIFISAHASDRQARARALEAGAVDFLYKPFNEEVLLKHVYAALQTSGGGRDGE